MMVQKVFNNKRLNKFIMAYIFIYSYKCLPGYYYSDLNVGWTIQCCNCTAIQKLEGPPGM